MCAINQDMPKRPANCRDIKALEQIVSDLRGPEGCPWDKEQTHKSLTAYAIEETFELVEALERAHDFNIKDELGDVLFQVVLHTQLAKERRAFDLSDVIENLSEKLIRRHPHVFADVSVSGIDEVWKNWDEIKRQEKAKAIAESPTPKSRLDVPAGLPALQRAAKIGSRTKKLNFDWDSAKQVYEKVLEESTEVHEAFQKSAASDFSSDKEALAEEIGDLFFSLAQLCRHLSLDPEQVARSANTKFENRFDKMMSLIEKEEVDFSQLSSESREDYWRKAKQNERS